MAFASFILQFAFLILHCLTAATGDFRTSNANSVVSNILGGMGEGACARETGLRRFCKFFQTHHELRKPLPVTPEQPPQIEEGGMSLATVPFGNRPPRTLSPHGIQVKFHHPQQRLGNQLHLERSQDRLFGPARHSSMPRRCFWSRKPSSWRNRAAPAATTCEAKRLLALQIRYHGLR